MELIEKQLAINAFMTATSDGDKAEWCVGILKSLPTVQPEIINCKDCKHSEHWYKDKSRCFLWHEEGIDVFEDGFCNYAERRADGRD